MSAGLQEGAAIGRSLHREEAVRRWVAWFHELDQWTEYWDVYRPETRGRFYFGDDADEPGLLTRFLPRATKPPAFTAWTKMAWGTGSRTEFTAAVREPAVTEAVLEIDALVDRLFVAHFGDARDPAVQLDYVEAMFEFAADTLPRATERDARIPADDPRKPTAGRHTLDGDLMWFAWALHTEAAHEIVGADDRHARRALLLAGIAVGCPVNFAWRGHRSTRREYKRDAVTAALLHARGLRWANDFDTTRREIHALYRIREHGE